MVEMLQDDKVTGLQADMWLTTLSFIQEPTMDMLTTIKVHLIYMTVFIYDFRENISNIF